MADDVYVTARIFDEDGNLVAAPGDTISAEDAKKWKVGSDGTQAGGEESVAPEPESSGTEKSSRRSGNR